MQDQNKEVQIKEAEIEIDRLNFKINDIDFRYGMGVRPSHISADLEMYLHEKRQLEAKIATLQWDLKKEDVLILTQRMRRKLDIMRMDQKASGSTRYHDTNELLTLLDILEKRLGLRDET